MKHVTYSDKSLLIGDEAADVLIEYAALLGREGGADTVDLRAISSAGDETTATFLLNAGSVLMVETATTKVEEPDNNGAILEMHARMLLITSPPSVLPYLEHENQEIE